MPRSQCCHNGAASEKFQWWSEGKDGHPAMGSKKTLLPVESFEAASVDTTHTPRPSSEGPKTKSNKLV